MDSCGVVGDISGGGGGGESGIALVVVIILEAVGTELPCT